MSSFVARPAHRASAVKKAPFIPPAAQSRTAASTVPVAAQAAVGCSHNLLDMRAVLLLGAFDIFQLSGQVLVRGQVLSQPNKRPDDQYVSTRRLDYS